MGYKDLIDSQRLDYYKRWKNGEPIIALAAEVGTYPATFERRLREIGQYHRETTEQEQVKKVEPAQVARKRPANEELFSLLKAHPYTLDELSKKFDRSKETVLEWINQMKKDGYVITEEAETVSFTGNTKPTAPEKLITTLADEAGQVITFAACSDLHAGSAYSQPTNHQKFLDIAYNEYGVRHVFDPGDKTTGVGGYRGQEHDMIPALRHSKYSLITEQQIFLADAYTPRYPGLKYYKLGGNHDYWHVVNSGIDAVAKLCEGRDDMTYLGYDVADIPLTDRVDIRLWHPSGGVPYALSYRLQKALEQTAFEELNRAVTENDNPRLRMVLAGPMHIECKFNRGPMMAVQCGCFEGQTNYLKRKGLFPQIGGSIFRVWLTDSGLIQRVEYTFINFMEILDDWKSWPIPLQMNVMQDPSPLSVLFRANEARIA
jgi:hypothetical protein